MASHDERVLVARLRASDADAFDEVYDAYRARVFAFLLRMSRSRTVAEDLLDETWLRLVRHAPKLVPDTRVAPWLFTVARNLYWNHRRDALVEESFVPELLTLWPSPPRGPPRSTWRWPVNSNGVSNGRCRHSHRNSGRSSCSSVTRA
jgi:RNA polymerase sigma-70 factor (ECF subfamily)